MPFAISVMMSSFSLSVRGWDLLVMDLRSLWSLSTSQKSIVSQIGQNQQTGHHEDVAIPPMSQPPSTTVFGSQQLDHDLHHT